MNASKFGLLSLVALLLLSAKSDSASSTHIQWERIENVLEVAERPIMIDMYTDWCGWCKRMDATTFKDPAVSAYVNETFHAVKFDAEQKDSIVFKEYVYKFVQQGRRGHHELAAALLNGKMSYPTVVFLDKDLGVITRVPGYQTARDFETIVHFVGEEAYKDTTWEAYKTSYESGKE